jgi:hypothetical protein
MVGHDIVSTSPLAAHGTLTVQKFLEGTIGRCRNLVEHASPCSVDAAFEPSFPA